MFEYPQATLDTDDVSSPILVAGDLKDVNKLAIIHGPFSPLHIESRYTEGAKVVTLSSDNESVYHIPKTEQVGNSQLYEKISLGLRNVHPAQRESLVKNFTSMMKSYGNQTYGEYQPGTYSLRTQDLLNMPDIDLSGKSLHPVLFVTNFLIQQSEVGLKSKEIVLHPDAIYFLAQGQKERVGSVLRYLDSISQNLNLKLFFENLDLRNPKMQRIFEMYTDPLQMLKQVEGYENLGVAIDIKHLESNKDEEAITNTLQSILRSNNPKKIVIHSRLGHEERYSSIYSKCVSLGIPWVVEP